MNQIARATAKARARPSVKTDARAPRQRNVNSVSTTVRHRLASFLLRQARKGGKCKNDGIEISLPASNQELAAQIGTLRELVAKPQPNACGRGARSRWPQRVIWGLKVLEDET